MPAVTLHSWYVRNLAKQSRVFIREAMVIRDVITRVPKNVCSKFSVVLRAKSGLAGYIAHVHVSDYRNMKFLLLHSLPGDGC